MPLKVAGDREDLPQAGRRVTARQTRGEKHDDGRHRMAEEGRRPLEASGFLSMSGGQASRGCHEVLEWCRRIRGERGVVGSAAS